MNKKGFGGKSPFFWASGESKRKISLLKKKNIRKKKEIV